MAEIANDIVIDETQNKETAEGVWALKKQVADAEAYKLQEEIKDERREMERKLRVDIDRTDGSLTADTPRSVLSLHYDNDGEPDDDDVVVSREEEEDLDPVETSLRQRKLLGDEAANQSKAYGTEQKKEGNGKQIAQTEADNPQRPSPSIEQESENTWNIVMESLDSIVDELIWRIEGGFHNKWDGFAVAHTPRINQEVRDVLALVIDAVDMQNEDFEPAAGGIEEEKDHGDVPVVKGSAEYERRMKAYLEMQASAIPESALKKALRDFDARLATEGVPLGKMAVFLRRHGQDISPLDAKASTMHDGQARSLCRADET